MNPTTGKTTTEEAAELAFQILAARDRNKRLQ